MNNVVEFKAKCAHGWEGPPSRCKDCRKEAYHVSRVGKADTRKKVIVSEDGRNCLSCKQMKPWNAFHTDVHGFNGRTARCRDCRNETFREAFRTNPNVRRGTLRDRPDRLKRFYGLTWEQVVTTLDAQNGLCANNTCGKKISLDTHGVGGNRAVIDHNHETGQFRALLCNSCNTILGTLETKEEIIIGLMEYKTKHSEDSRLIEKTT